MGAEMGVQKVLESDGWVNPDMSHCACTGSPTESGAESVCGAAGVGTGVGGDLTRGSTPETDGVCPSTASALWAFPATGFSVCKASSPRLVLRQLLSHCCAG